MFAQLPKVLNYGQPFNATAPLNRGCTAWWMCLPQRNGGNRWLELRNRNVGTLGNGTSGTQPAWSSIKRPGGFGALKFDGSNDQVSCGTGVDTSDLAKTSGNSGATLSFWLCPSVLTGGTIAARNDGNSVSPGWWLIFIGAELQLRLERSSANAAFSISTASWSTNDWKHVTWTTDGNGATPTVTAYVNGVSVTVTTTVSGTGTSASDSAETLYFGRYGKTSGGGNGFYSGLLDDFRFYKGRILSPSDARALYIASRAGYKRELNWLDRPWLIQASEAAPATNFYVIGSGCGGASSVIGE